MSDLDKALYDLRAIGARFSPEARLGAEFANPQAIGGPAPAAAPPPQLGEMPPDFVGPGSGPAGGIDPAQVAAQQPGGPQAPPNPAGLAGPASTPLAMAATPMGQMNGGPPVQGLDTPSPQLSPSMQNGLAVAQAEPQDPYAPGAPGAPPPLPATEADQEDALNGGMAAYQDALDAQGKAELAAEKDHATKKYEATMAYNRDMEKADAERTRDLQAMNAKNDLETAAWVQQMSDQAKKEPNPRRYWENSSGLSKALWALGIVAGAGYVALTPGAQNAALQMFNHEVDRDVAMQEARLKREQAVLELKGRVMEKRQDRNRTDLTDRYTMKYQRLAAVERAAEAQAVIPGDLDAAAKKAQSIALVQKAKLQVMQDKLGVLQKRTDAQVQMAHADKLQRAGFAHDAAQETLRFEHEKVLQQQKDDAALARSPVSLSGQVGAGSSRNPLNKDRVPTYYELQSGKGNGLVLQDKATKQAANGDGIILYRDKDTWVNDQKIVRDANQRYTDMVKLRDALDQSGIGPLTLLAGVTDPKLNALVEKVAYSIAGAENKVVTDKDKSSGLAQAIGFDPNSKVLDRAKSVLSVGKMKDWLDESIAAMPEAVSNSMTIDGAINGQGVEAKWEPRFISGPDAPAPRTQRDMRGQTLKAVETPGAYSEEGYKASIEAGKKNQFDQTIAPHDPGPVAAILSTTQAKDGTKQYASPTDIRGEASRILGDLDKRIAAANPDSFTLGRAPTADDVAEWNRLKNTKVIVTSLAEDQAKKAEAVLSKFKDWAAHASGWEGFSDKSMKDKASRMGLDRMPAEVQSIIEAHDALVDERARAGKNAVTDVYDTLGAATKKD